MQDTLGLEEKYDYGSTELSGDEQQRVAKARALANNPMSPQPISTPRTDTMWWKCYGIYREKVIPRSL